VIKGHLQHVTNDYLSRLKAREQRAEQALEAAYQHVLTAIQPKLDALYNQMVEARAGGEQIPLYWLYEANRLQSLTSFIENQVQHFGAFTQSQVTQLQHQAVALGADAAQDQLQATLPPGTQYAFNLPNPKAIANLVGSTQAGSPLASLFAGFGSEAAQKARDALVVGVATGQHPRTVAAALQESLGTSRSRALTIARTEMMRSYRGASLQTYRENANVVQSWQWLAAAGACAVCVALNGTIHELEDDFATHPRCRCSPVPVTVPWSSILGTDPGDDLSFGDVLTGADWFDQQSASTQQEILGPAKYAAYQDDAITLDDLIGTSHSADWGTSRYEKSLKEILGASAAQKYYAKAS
jgi:SPP1 gp7 family putative phage head morphogenesis protein